MAKRKYSGSSSMKKKRRTGRRYGKKSKKQSVINSTRGGTSGTLFKNNRLSKRSYKNQLYKSLMFKEKYRSIRALNTTVTDVIVNAAAKLWQVYPTPDNFYLTAGGFLGSETFALSKFIIKGGQLYLNYRNDMDTNVTVEWGIVRFYNSEAEGELTGQQTDVTADISVWDSFGTGMKLVQPMRRIVMEPNATTEMRMKIPFTIINDLNQWVTEGYGKYAIVATLFPNSGGALNIARTLGHNLTFVADAVTP